MQIIPRIAAYLKDNAPSGVFNFSKAIYQIIFAPKKTKGEMDFWRMQFTREGGTLSNNHFEEVMRAMALPLQQNDFDQKVICDFGCGPRGSLTWLADSAHCIGIDVLVHDYFREFPDVIQSNRMTYIGCSEDYIPMQTGQADIVFTMNALDHVINLQKMCDEIFRVIRPGGYFVGSFNLGEEPTVTEPQSFSENSLNSVLLGRFEKISVRQAPKFSDDTYAGFFGREAPVGYNGPTVLWFVGRKPRD